MGRRCCEINLLLVHIVVKGALKCMENEESVFPSLMHKGTRQILQIQLEILFGKRISNEFISLAGFGMETALG